MSLTQWCPVSRLSETIGDRWSLQILRELSIGPQRFKSLKNNIAGISMDQLSRKLESLCANFLIVRQEFSESPPRVEYQLTEKGRSFVPVMRRLISWSTENLWGPPERSEDVDVGLTLRTIAAFFGAGSGRVLIRIFFSKGREFYLVERAESGHVKVTNSDDGLFDGGGIDATLEVSIEEWIRIITEATATNKIQVRAHITGNKILLMKMFSVFSFVNWIDETRPFSSFGEPESMNEIDQGAWRNHTSNHTARATRTR